MAPRTNKKLLVVLLVAIGVLAIPGLMFAFLYVRDLRSDASTEVPPRSIQIVNHVDNSVDIMWVTDIPATGKVRYTGSVNGEASDIRGDGFKGHAHVVRLRGLDPKTTYTYKIVSEGKEYHTGTVTTFDSVLTEPKSFAGTAKNGDQSAKSDSLVKATLIEKGSGKQVNATSLGTVTADNGTWTLDAGNFRTSTGEKIASFNNYLVQVELYEKDGRVVGRTISPDVASGQTVALFVGVLEDPVKVASAYTGATVREPETPTTTSTPIPTSTNSPPIPTIAKATVSNAQIVNKLDGTFAIVWETDIPTNSYVTYTINGSNKSSAFDKRSNEKLSRSLRTHFVEITDTTNPVGTKYEITLINNGEAWKETIRYEKITTNETPALDSIKLNFEQKGNFMDQILLVNIPGKTTTIAATPSMLGTALLDLSALRQSSNASARYNLTAADTLSFTLLGGTLSNKSTLDAKKVSELRSANTNTIQSTPKDLTPFKIIYINIEDGAVIKEFSPEFAGEGFKPSSDLKIQIEKQ